MLTERIPKYLATGAEAGYLVGGAVRDLLWGRQPLDFDMVVPGNPALKASQLAMAIEGHSIKLGRDPYPLYRVIHPAGMIDITAIKGNGIDTDLRQRDFTINAMAFDLSSKKLIDPLNGAADLADQVVRMTTADSFSSDPARLVRAHRMAASFNFTIDPQTSKRIAEQAFLIDGIAGERIWPELQAILLVSDSSIQIDAMQTNGLLAALFGEAACCDKNGGQHSLNALANLEKILGRPEVYVPGEAVHFVKAMTEKERILSKMALLLHEMNHRCPYVPGRASSSLGHDPTHAGPVDNIPTICRRLRTSTRDRNWITIVVSHLPYPTTLYRHPHKRDTARFFKSAGHHAPHILILNLAESLYFHEPNTSKLDIIQNSFNELIKFYFNEMQALLDQPPLINGRELIEAMGLDASPLIGELIDMLEQARLECKIQNRDQALELAKRFMNAHR